MFGIELDGFVDDSQPLLILSEHGEQLGQTALEDAVGAIQRDRFLDFLPSIAWVLHEPIGVRDVLVRQAALENSIANC